MTDHDPAEMHRAVSADPRRSYARLGDDGTLFLIAEGRGLSIRMDSTELRRFAACALAIADGLDQREREVADEALVQLARIAGAAP